MDNSGNLSKAAAAIRVHRPDEAKGKTKNTTRRFKKPRKPADEQAPPAPTNLQAEVQANGVVRFTWDPVAAAARCMACSMR
jgi:hypothetical protein